MNCEQARPLIEPYADGELDAARILELEQHIGDCSTCALARRDQKVLNRVMKQGALFFPAPAGLRRRIKDELDSFAGTEPERKFWNWNWLATATTAFAAACLALLLSFALIRPSARQQLAQEIVSSHIRSLMANHALDIASSDQHTVKPWFDGKLTFAPPVKDLAAQEFPLVGGRLDFLDGNTVAALVYQRHKHIINVFIRPTKESDSNPATFAPLQGYNLIHWSQAGMTFWAVSDVNTHELLEFSQAWAGSLLPSK